MAKLTSLSLNGGLVISGDGYPIKRFLTGSNEPATIIAIIQPYACFWVSHQFIKGFQ